MTFLAVTFLLYFAPAVVASTRRHRSATAIWFANTLLGWTVVGWVACLIWAASGPRAIVLYPVMRYSVPEGSVNSPGAWSTGANRRETICAICQRPLLQGASFCSACGANASSV